MDNTASQNSKQSASKKVPAALVVARVFLCLAAACLIFAFLPGSSKYENPFSPGSAAGSAAALSVDSADTVHMTQLSLSATETGPYSADYQLEVYDQDGALAGIIRPADIIRDGDVKDHIDQELLLALIRSWDLFNPAYMELPVDAHASDYIPAIKGYELIPETPGNIVNMDKALAAITAAIHETQTRLNLAEADCYVRAIKSADTYGVALGVAMLNHLVSSRITYDWNGTEVILDGDTIHQWIIPGERGNHSLDKAAMDSFVAHQAAENDSRGQSPHFRTTAGAEIPLVSGATGFRTDQAAEAGALYELIMAGTQTERLPIYRNLGWHGGQNDAGASYVEIDLGSQHLYLYVDGELILDSVIVSGNMGRGWRSPAGLFAVYYKTTNTVLRGPGYARPVSYWMPYHGNYGMHDANWRSEFGNDIYLRNGSRGCINLPYEIAKELYSHVSVGFPVVCYY